MFAGLWGQDLESGLPDCKACALTHPSVGILKKEFLPWLTGWISASQRSLSSESG